MTISRHLFDASRFLSAVGDCTSATVSFYTAGTLSLATIYTDAALTIPATNPFTIAVGALVPVFYLDPAILYRRRIVYSDGTVHDVDNISNPLLSGELAGVNGASLIGYGTITIEDALDNALFDTSYGVKADGVTDDSAATNAFLAALSAKGGVGFMKPGPRLLASQVFIDRNQPNSVQILGYGVKLKTSHAGSAFWIKNGYDFYGTEVCGINVEETANNLALCGFEQTRTTNVIWRNCYVNSLANIVNSLYGGFFLHNAVPADNDTGCFWTYFPGSGVRRSGSGEFNYGVKLQGAANATYFDGIKITGVADGIKIQPETGQSYLSNGVFVTGAAIEGTSGHAVRIIGNGVATTCPGGVVVDNNRFESVVGSVLSIEGCTVSAPRWPVVGENNAIDTTVSAGVSIVNNPNNLRVAFDYHDADRTERVTKLGAAGMVLESVTATNDILDLRAANVNSGLSLSNNTGSTLYGWCRYVASGVLELAGNAASSIGLALSAVRGISGTATRANNLRGVATFAGTTSLVVTLPIAETDSTYFVYLSPRVANGGCWVSARGTTTFTINFNAAYTGGVDWLLVR